MFLPVPYEIHWGFHEKFHRKHLPLLGFFLIHVINFLSLVYIWKEPCMCLLDNLCLFRKWEYIILLFWDPLKDPRFWQSSVVYWDAIWKSKGYFKKEEKVRPLYWELGKLQLTYSTSIGWYLNFKTLLFFLSFLVTQENKL